MKLYYSTASPFARKVQLSAMALGLGHEVELVTVNVLGPNRSYVTKINPLNKIPALETREGTVLTNSPFICDYLNSLSAGKKILPLYGPERWRILNHQSIGDGIMEAAVLRLLETRRRPDRRDPDFDRRQWDKIFEGLQHFQNHLSEFQGDIQLDSITLMCALGYLEFRFPHEKWPEKFPRLHEWYKKKSSWEAFVKTVPK